MISVHHIGQKIKRVLAPLDPVMVATSGARLLQKKAMQSLKEKLFPLATLLTPNLDEAALLLGERISSVSAMSEAAQLLQRRFNCSILLKGGHLKGEKAIDILVMRREVIVMETPFVPALHTHGTGCTLSAAITAHLAKGISLKEAVQAGKAFVTRAIQRRKRLGNYEVLNQLP